MYLCFISKSICLLRRPVSVYLFIVSMLFRFSISSPTCNVQCTVKYKCKIEYEIIARFLRNCYSKQKLLPDIGILNVDFFLIQSHKFFFFQKYIKEKHLNCKIKHLLILKILKLRFWPSINKK